MSSQISHIVYAKRLFDRLEKGWLESSFFDGETIKKILNNRDDFLLGCVFPDVRMVAENLARKDTHMYFGEVNLDFKDLTAFQSGWKFHVFCDMKREEILNKYGFYELTKNIEKSWMANKLLEDRVIYDVYNNWEKLRYYFNNVPHIDLLGGLSREALELWYAIISKYIEKKPDYKAMHIYALKVKKTDIKKADWIVEKVIELEKNPLVIDILGKVYQQII